MSGRRAGLGIGAVILVLFLIVALARPRQDPYLRRPLDPRGTGPDGLAALVAVLRGSDAGVRLGGLPEAGDDVVLQVADTFSGTPSTRVSDWVRAGGTLVVTDPNGRLAAPANRSSTVRSRGRGTCRLDALASVAELGVAIPRALAITPGTTVCFAGTDGAGLVVRRLGRGLVVTLSSYEPFLNRALGTGDDAALAVALLAPRVGTQVRVLDPTRFVSDAKVGDGTVLGAVGDRTRQAMLELVVAFLAWGFFRGRRLGKVVPEELPVTVPSSDLVLAIGEMLGRGDDLGAIAERLRRRARRELGLAIGLGAAPDPATLIATLQAHVTLDAAGLRRALVDPVPDIASLLDVSHQLDRLLEELHATHAAT